MKFKEQFIGAFGSLFLTLGMLWTIGSAAALAHRAPPERNGVVEIYSLVAADDSHPGV